MTFYLSLFFFNFFLYGALLDFGLLFSNICLVSRLALNNIYVEVDFSFISCMFGRHMFASMITRLIFALPYYVDVA